MMLRNGVPYGSFVELVKWAYVDVAAKEFGIEGRKQTDSRVATITGLSRKEVRRVRLRPVPDDMDTAARYNRAARVIGGWRRDKRFADGAGRPAALDFDDGDNSFSSLVREYSGDMTARAILDELLRVGAAEQQKNGRIRLKARAYVPGYDEDEKLGILGVDVADLITTIDHNLQKNNGDARFQRKVAYDNLPEEALPRYRKLSARQSQALLERLDKWLAEQDRDTNPSATGTGRWRAGIGIYYFEENVEEQVDDDA